MWKVGLGALWVLSLPILTAGRMSLWQDELRLWQEAADWGPYKLRPRVQLATLEHKRGAVGLAERDYRWAFGLWQLGRPPHERIGCQVAQFNFRVLLEQQGDFASAQSLSDHSPCGSGSSSSR